VADQEQLLSFGHGGKGSASLPLSANFGGC
jgi:hypothetical protein